MKLLIKKISLEWFKGITDLDINFVDTTTIIKGRNGAGKSTIADALSWLLFGKNAKGETTFGIKTRDNQGNDIPHKDHSVTAVFLIDGKEVTLSRTLKEKWTKQRGSDEEILSSNVTKYMINGEEVTKTDYDKYVYSIAAVNLFSLLSIPAAFCNQHWQDQRKLLSDIAGKIDIAKVASEDARYATLLKELEDQSLEAYRKHLTYQIRELKKSIAEMPVKVQTLNQTLPVCEGTEEELTALLEDITKQLKSVDAEIAATKAGDADVYAVKNIKDKIMFAERRIQNMETSKRNLAREEMESHEAKVRDSFMQLCDAKSSHESLQKKRVSLYSIIDKTNESIEEIKTQLAMGNVDWRNLKEEKFVFDEKMTVCPTCGQPLPVEQAQERYKDALNSYNLSKAARKEALLKKAEKLNADLEQAKTLKQENIEMLSVTDEQIQASTSAIKELESKYNEILNEQPPTAQDLLDADENYIQVKAELESLYESLESPSESQADTSALETEKENLQHDIEEVKRKIYDCQNFTRITKLIDDTKTQWQELNKQLTALEQKEDVAIALSDRMDSLLEDSVNSHFSIVKFKLFRTLVDGVTKEPFCTATLNGVDYRDCSAAQKTNMSLDIINTLSRHFDTYVPCFIDNAEGVNKILDTQSQQIRLYVTADPNIIVE